MSFNGRRHSLCQDKIKCTTTTVQVESTLIKWQSVEAFCLKCDSGMLIESCLGNLFSLSAGGGQYFVK